MKRTSKCWISPDGQVITCPDHKISAKHIITERYPEYKNQDVLDFLYNKGWARFCDVLWALSGNGWVIPQHLTTRQRDKIFDLTQEWFGWKMGSISALPFFTLNTHSTSQQLYLFTLHTLMRINLESV